MSDPLVPEGLEPEDAALQRRLETAFSRISPRPGFEDTLWLGLESGARPPRRVRLHLPRVAVPRRVWPALGAAATVLVLAAAVLPLLLQGHRGGQPAAARPATSAAWFGLLPAPQLSTNAGQSPASQTAETGAVPYYGPAQLSIAGAAPTLPLSLPVFRFSQPSSQQEDAWARAHGGQAMMQSSGQFREPRIQIVAAGTFAPSHPCCTQPAPPAEAQALAAAKAFLADHKVAGWPHQPEVAEQGDLALVRYTRRFQVKSYGEAPQVDTSGAHAGADVAVRPDGKVAEATVPMDMPMQSFAYAARAGEQVAKDALGSAPASSAVLTPLPRVKLSKASLVYIAVADRGFGYFEPAFLFTGFFSSGATLYEKRVLVPALDASQLRP